jgi:transcriptional regulator with XRE-family HTH domain
MDGKDIRRLFGSNVKRLRTRYGLSQLTLATEIGMTHNFINDIENGKKWVSSQTIAKLAQRLHVQPADFFMSDTTQEQQEANFITTYIDDLSQSVLKAVTETKSRYMRDTLHGTTDAEHGKKE